MKIISGRIKKTALIFVAGLFFISLETTAQRHGGGGHRAGAKMHSKGAGHVAKPNPNHNHSAVKPSVKPAARPKKINAGPKRSFSGSSKLNSANHAAGKKRYNSPARKNTASRNKSDGRNKHISGNKISKNRNNININVNNSIHVRNNRNTIVRPAHRPYARPPHIYGGYRYNAFHPYFYHPYRPFYWGPVWHPWGFFVTTLAVTAIVVSVENAQYHYDQGVWYTSSDGGYTAVPAPVGGTVNNIPSGAQTVNTGTVNNYYYGGTYYEKEGDNYKVVAPTAGTIVDSLPEGGEEITIGDVKYVKFGETYYQPVQIDGKDRYEVALVEQVQ